LTAEKGEKERRENGKEGVGVRIESTPPPRGRSFQKKGKKEREENKKE